MGTDDEFELLILREELEDEHDLNVLKQLMRFRQKRDSARLKLAAKAKEVGLNPDDYAPRRGRPGDIGSFISAAGGSSVSISVGPGERLIIRGGQRVYDENSSNNSSNYTTLVEAMLGAADSIRNHRFTPGGRVVSVPFVEYRNGMLYVPARDELNCSLRHPKTGLVLESGYTPLEQRFRRRIEKPTLGNDVTLDRRVTALTYSIDASKREEGVGTFNISALDAVLEGSGEDTRGFRVMYTWEGSYDVTQNPVATPVCRKEVRVYDGEHAWVCDFSDEGILSQARLLDASAKVHDKYSLYTMPFDRENPPIDQPDIKNESVDALEIKLRGFLERYQLTHATHHRVDWDATLRNIVAGNSTALAYVGE